MAVLLSGNLLSERAVVRTSGECAWPKKVSKTLPLVFELLKLTIARRIVTVKNCNWQNHSYQQLARWLVFKQYVYGFIF